MNEQIIEDPRASEIAQALEDGDELQFLNHKNADTEHWVKVSELTSFASLSHGKIRIVKKPKIVLTAYGYDFTADELPASVLADEVEYFLALANGDIHSYYFFSKTPTHVQRLQNHRCFSSHEAAAKWHAMTQAFFDEILKGVLK